MNEIRRIASAALCIALLGGSPAASGQAIQTFSDYNADGRADLLWLHAAADHQLWLMLGLTANFVASFARPLAYDGVTHTADIDGDGAPELMVESGERLDAWNVQNGNPTYARTFLPGSQTFPPGWQVVASGDLDGNGTQDLLLEHTDGSVGAWLMNGMNDPLEVATFVPAGSNWRVSHVADLDGDGRADLVLETPDGAVHAWLMNGLTPIGVASLANPGSDWHVQLTADFNADGKQDLLWMHRNGATQVWLMDGLNVAGVASFTGAGSRWIPVDAGDISGDGRADIFWMRMDGASQTWLMDGLLVTGVASFVPPGAQWRATHLLDLDGDGRRDVLWRHDNGAVQAWLLNGLLVSSVAMLAGPTDYYVSPVNGTRAQWGPDYRMRQRVWEVIDAAERCRAMVQSYYEANSAMPSDAAQAGCASVGTPNSSAPLVSPSGHVIVDVAGSLVSELGTRTFALAPQCDGGTCNGPPLAGWDCSAANTLTTITPKYLPLICR